MGKISKKLILLFVIVMVAAVILTGCKSTGDVPEEQWEEIIPEEPAGIPVENDYMTFTYPQEWEGKVEAQPIEEDGNVRVSFQTEISGENLELFAVIMGPQVTDGYILGQLEDPETGTIYVSTDMNEVNREDWSEDDYNEICALQERVNDIIVQFYDDERFVPAK